jgi:integrase
MNTRFFTQVKEKDGKEVAYIFAAISGNGLSLRIATGIKVEPLKWNHKKQEIRGTDLNSIACNQKLKNILTAINQLSDKHLTSRAPLTSQIIKAELLKIIAPHRAEKLEPVRMESDDFSFNNLIDITEYYITANPKNLKKNSIKAYKTFLSVLNRYADSHGISSLRFENINLTFEENITKFLNKNEYRQNYSDKIKMFVKSIMSYATDKGWNSNMEYKKIKRKPEQVDTISLTEAEIELIRKASIPANLESARNIFVFSCLTGLRFSDYMNIEPENRDGEYLNIKTIKTGNFITVPLVEKAARILDKYEGRFPRIADATFNRQIKDVCKLIPKLCVNEIVHSSAGGVRNDKKAKKYQLIASHTGRRTFATNAVLKGIPIPLIMKITGHETIAAFQRYVRVDKKMDAVLMLKALKGKAA